MLKSFLDALQLDIENSYFAAVRQFLASLEANPQNQETLIAGLSNHASKTLYAVERFGIFNKKPLNPDERKLAILLQLKNTKGVVEWIKTMEAKQPLMSEGSSNCYSYK